MSASDMALVKAIAAGDAEAMRALYDRHATPLFRYALGRTGDRAAAEDAVQETMLATWRGAARFREESSVRTWLFGICRNRLAERAKRREFKAEVVPIDRLGELSGGGATAAAVPETLDFWRAFDRLADEHREVILLVFHYGFSLRETADLLEIPVGTVKSRVHHARRRLEAALAGEAGEGSDEPPVSGVCEPGAAKRATEGRCGT